MYKTENIEQLAAQLHDGIGGTLATITTLARYGETLEDRNLSREAFAQIAQLSGKGVAELRAFLNALKSKESCRNLTTGN